MPVTGRDVVSTTGKGLAHLGAYFVTPTGVALLVNAKALGAFLDGVVGASVQPGAK